MYKFVIVWKRLIHSVFSIKVSVFKRNTVCFAMKEYNTTDVFKRKVALSSFAHVPGRQRATGSATGSTGNSTGETTGDIGNGEGKARAQEEEPAKEPAKERAEALPKRPALCVKHTEEGR